MYKLLGIVLLYCISYTFMHGFTYKLPATKVVAKYNNYNVFINGFSKTTTLQFNSSLAESLFSNTNYNQPYIFSIKGNSSVAGYSAVIIDGVKILDTSNTNLFLDISMLNSNVLSKAKVVGANLSTLYGSGSAFGVLLLNTKNINTNYTSVGLQVGFPSYNLVSLVQNFNINNFNLTFFGSNNTVNQISLAKQLPNGNKATEKDKTTALNSAFKLNYNNNNLQINAMYYYNKANINFDAFNTTTNTPVDNPINKSINHTNIAYATLKHSFNKFNYNLYALNNVLQRKYTNYVYGESKFIGKQTSIGLNTNWQYKKVKLNIGTALENQYYSHKNLLYADNYINFYNYFNNMQIMYGYRNNTMLSNNNNAKQHNNAFVVDYKLQLNNNYSVFVNSGVGYRNPSIYQQANTNSNLQAEVSKTLDIALQYANNNSVINNKFFIAKTSNLINFSNANFKYYNSNNTIINKGFTTQFSYNLKNINLNTSYNYYLQPVKLTANKLNAQVKYTYKKLSTSLQMLAYSSKQHCLYNKVCNTLSGYAYFNYMLQYNLASRKFNYNLFVKVNNILNKKYYTNYLYNNTGFAVYVGFRLFK